MKKTVYVGFTGMNNSSVTMDFLLDSVLGNQNISGYDRMSCGYPSWFEMNHYIYRRMDFFADRFSKADEILIVGYSFGAQVALEMLAEVKRYLPDVVDKVKLRLIAPYFSPKCLKFGSRINLFAAKILPWAIAERLDSKYDIESAKVQSSIAMDYCKLEDPYFDFFRYREVNERIWEDRSFAKIIAEAKAMNQPLSYEVYDLGLKDVKIFLAEKDEFLKNNIQELETQRIFGETAEIIWVDATHTGFPFEKKWVKAVREHF